MKHLLITTLVLLSFSVQSEIYLDLSAEIHDKNYDSFYQRNGEHIKNFIGSVELGYEFEKYSVFIKHSSSVQQEDTGLNTIGIKIRIY